jgi:type IV pilus assembly protein PilY1
VPNRIQGTAVVGTTRTPTANNICQPGGTGYVMAIDPFTGARLPNTYFDVNGDGVFNDSDKLSVAGNLTVVSGIGFDAGANNPIFVEGIMQVGMDDGSTRIVKTQGTSNASRRLGWREILN